ncbi:MAG TPA: hypothetical protein VNY05_42490 [Candidatus Acidoferrales bacterium]|nr:hypothetical protein [Candidatus Acidoferrales bacterium]
MAFGKAASGLILAAWFVGSTPAQGEQFPAAFPMRHEHLRKGCAGTLTVDEQGVRFTGAGFSGTKKHAWAWDYPDIRQLTLSPGSIHILTYEDSKLRPGAGRQYRFTGKVPAQALYGLLRDRMDQRFVAAVVPTPGTVAPNPGTVDPAPGLTLPVKHLGTIAGIIVGGRAGTHAGTQGTLAFGADSIAYATPAKDDSRTWRYTDIDTISSSGPFELTITTREKTFNFQLKQPITETRYNELWLQIERKNGRIQ